MNILFFIHRYPNYGGTEKVTTVLCNELQKKGNNVFLVSLYQKSWELMDELSSNVSFIPLHYPTINFDNIRRLHKIIVDNKIEIVINQWCLPLTTTILLKCALFGTTAKLISVLHGSPNVNMRLISVARKANTANAIKRSFLSILWKLVYLVTRIDLRIVYRLSDKYILLSDRFADVFKKMAWLRSSTKLTSITNPITINVTKEDLAFVSDKKKKILYVGRMDLLNKNVDRIIKAWGKICNAYTDWVLVLVGDGPDKPYLETLAAKLSIKNIKFTGFIKEEPVAYYKESSILMLASDLEGFGLVITEAMYFGCIPVVYGSYPAIYDIISDGECGFITPQPYNENYTCEKLATLIENQQLRRIMSKKAIEKAVTFLPEQVIKKWEDLFNAILV